ncbi:hypothetical protein GYH30_014641 [Glycine max]|nr:hypothetical protein GYH30_014641 [Glycine max]
MQSVWIQQVNFLFLFLVRQVPECYLFSNLSKDTPHLFTLLFLYWELLHIQTHGGGPLCWRWTNPCVGNGLL